MKFFRAVTLIVVCMGLALPSAHALALCIDSDGSFALDVAVNGACSGSRARGDDAWQTRSIAAAAAPTSFSAAAAA